MRIRLASIAQRAGTGAAQQLLEEYMRRTQPLQAVECLLYRSEALLLAALERERARMAPVLLLLDARGRAVTSEEMAALVREHRETGTQLLVFAVGPADGWSEAARRAHRMLSLGAMTLPHELARAVLAEQIYRACTILAGHPYHAGH